MKQANIPDARYEEHHKFPKWHTLYLLSLIPAYFLFSNKLGESLSSLLIMVSKQMKFVYMNQTSPVFSLLEYLFSVIAWKSVQRISV